MHGTDGGKRFDGAGHVAEWSLLGEVHCHGGILVLIMFITAHLSS